MSNAEDHLIHTAADAAGMLDLSTRAGLGRLSLEMHRLLSGERLNSTAGTERFLYVLNGAGSLRSDADAVSETMDIGGGDFIALTEDESAVLNTNQGIAVLIGASGKS